MSTPNPVYIVDIIGDIVDKVNAIVTPKIQATYPKTVKVNYIYDTPKRIIETLVQMSKAESTAPKRYPLVALFQPFTEKHGSVIGLSNTATIRIIIGHFSNDTDKSINRYEKVFKPVLYPVYLELLNQIDREPRIQSYGVSTLAHTKIDWPYWGGDDAQKANPFNDWLDIIEIRDLVLNFKLNIC